jgi:hypothetical protein
MQGAEDEIIRVSRRCVMERGASARFIVAFHQAARFDTPHIGFTLKRRERRALPRLCLNSLRFPADEIFGQIPDVFR